MKHYTFDTGTVRTEIGYHQISIEGLEIDVLALWLKKWRERSHQWEGLFAVDEKKRSLSTPGLCTVARRLLLYH